MFYLGVIVIKSCICWGCSKTNKFDCSWFNNFTIPEGCEYIEMPNRKGYKYVNRIIITDCPNFSPVLKNKNINVKRKHKKSSVMRGPCGQEVEQLELYSNKVIASYPSVVTAAKAVGVRSGTLYSHLRPTSVSPCVRGYRWRYKGTEAKEFTFYCKKENEKIVKCWRSAQMMCNEEQISMTKLRKSNYKLVVDGVWYGKVTI